MDFISIYTAWLGLFSISFTFMPIGLVLEWKKRGTADGFSSVNFVLPMIICSCWFKHGLITGDAANIYINLVNLFFFVIYLSAFAYYQPKRQYLIGQLSAAFVTVLSIYLYVDAQAESERANVMGNIASFMQIAANAGGIYEIKRVISMGTTEYLPAQFQYAIFLLIVQWTLFGIITDNIYIVRANIVGLFVNITTICLYYFYPPRTWRVPFIGTGPTEKKQD